MLSIEGMLVRAAMFPHSGSRSTVEIDLTPEGDHYFQRLQEQCQGDDTAELVRRYTQGGCGVLATCLHQLLGWDVYGVYACRPSLLYSTLGYEYLPFKWHQHPDHAVVRNPTTGRYVDARGTNLTQSDLGEVYRKYYGPRARVSLRRMDDPDMFRRRPEAYSVCLLDHLPRLFPGLLQET